MQIINWHSSLNPYVLVFTMNFSICHDLWFSTLAAFCIEKICKMSDVKIYKPKCKQPLLLCDFFLWGMPWVSEFLPWFSYDELAELCARWFIYILWVTGPSSLLLCSQSVILFSSLKTKFPEVHEHYNLARMKSHVSGRDLKYWHYRVSPQIEVHSIELILLSRSSTDRSVRAQDNHVTVIWVLTMKCALVGGHAMDWSCSRVPAAFDIVWGCACCRRWRWWQ